MTAVVVDGFGSKEYRLPDIQELKTAQETSSHIIGTFRDIPFGLPTEPLPGKERHRAAGSQLTSYGLKYWADLFTSRQLLTLGTFVKHTRAARTAMNTEGYPPEWIEATTGYLAMAFDKIVDRGSTLCTFVPTRETIGHTFVRFALPITWDFAESAPLNDSTGGYPGAISWVARYISHAMNACASAGVPQVIAQSATTTELGQSDFIITDPPYYDAIPYSDLMDFFYVWLRRNIGDMYPEEFSRELSDKSEELVQQHNTGPQASPGKLFYETGMSEAFRAAHIALKTNGRLVIVFANKQPDAWETLVTSIIRAGFVVDASWPIETEMRNRVLAMGTASLSSSVWLACRKRPESARPGWDNQVLEEMRIRIYERLRDFWDAGIRGPDFVWAATGPALEVYSKHPVVKKADEPNAVMTVSEFLWHVRRIVVDYVVGKVLSRNGNGQAAEGLDDLTLYYLLHRHDFGLEEAPVGACILYAQSCNLADRDLVDRYDLLAYGKSRAALEAEEDEGEEGDEAGGEKATSGSTVKLKRWDQRLRKDLGINTGGRVAPLIDQAHHIMHLWRAGDVQKVDSYLEDQGLRRNPLFPRLLQALIELAGKNNQPEERSLLESIMNHVTARGAHPQMRLLDDEEA